MASGAFAAKLMGWNTLAVALSRCFSPGSLCGVPAARSGWYTSGERQALVVHLAAPQPRNAVGARSWPPLECQRTSGITAPCVSYRPAWRARSAERPIARDMSGKVRKSCSAAPFFIFLGGFSTKNGFLLFSRVTEQLRYGLLFFFFCSFAWGFTNTNRAQERGACAAMRE